jgi:energy-coupling factor transport system substrate-specific component
MSWIAGSFVVLGAALVAGFAWYERRHPSTRVLALVATLAALAALGRIAFAALPNVKPTTDIVLIAGYVLGGAPGFVVGAVAALASNLFFGQGPWTPWQMVAWGGVGVLGAVLARVTRRRLSRVPLALACAAAGFGFGAVMNTSQWVIYSGDHTTAKLAAEFATAFSFDLAHAIGNFVFCIAFGPALINALARYRTRFEITWAPVAAAGAFLILAAGLQAPSHAQAQSTSAGYLQRAQNADGGWGGTPGQASSPLVSGWTALGLAAAGRSPAEVRKRTSALAYVRAHGGSDTGGLERTILVLATAGRVPKSLTSRLVSRRSANGSFAGRVNTTAFAILALRAAGRSRRDATVRRAASWILRQANADGGFNFAARGSPSGIDDTGAAIQALAAAGLKTTKVVRRAAGYLVARQNPDGGFPLQRGAGSNAQSTAWAIQGLLAAGRDPARIRRGGGRDGLAYLRSLTAPDGEVRYSRTSRQTPVWVTGQALMALARKPLPIGRVTP